MAIIGSLHELDPPFVPAFVYYACLLYAAKPARYLTLAPWALFRVPKVHRHRG